MLYITFSDSLLNRERHLPSLLEVGRQLSPPFQAPFRKMWKSASSCTIEPAPHFPRRNLGVGRRLRYPRPKHGRLGRRTLRVRVMAVALTLMVMGAVVEIGRPLREGHRWRPLSRTALCHRVRPRGRGELGDPVAAVAESPPLVRRALIDTEIDFATTSALLSSYHVL